ncbi:MAG: hypothetical protein J6K84_00770 [Oscillospiraceae bacterium]|nr:hypothetical protein [Oscillospiraceae bacterium]
MKAFFSRLRAKWLALKEREQKKMEHMTFRQKVEYISSAWGLEIIVTIMVLVTIGFGIYFIDNSTKDYILTVGVVNSQLTEDDVKTIRKDVKNYIGDHNRKHVVLVEGNLSDRAATPDPLDDVSTIEEQQFALTLILSGAVDCYLATETYIKFLNHYETIVPVKDVLTEENFAKYSHLLREDGMGLLIDDPDAKAYFTLPDEPIYLVYTATVHYPDVVNSFTTFLLEK